MQTEPKLRHTGLRQHVLWAIIVSASCAKVSKQATYRCALSRSAGQTVLASDMEYCSENQAFKRIATLSQSIRQCRIAPLLPFLQPLRSIATRASVECCELDHVRSMRIASRWSVGFHREDVLLCGEGLLCVPRWLYVPAAPWVYLPCAGSE